MQNETSGKGIFYVILAGICWGIISIFIRGMNSLGFDSMMIICIRAWLSVLLLFIYFLIRDKKLLHIDLKDLWMFVGTGIISLTFFSYCYFSSIIRCGAAVAVVLLYTSPIFVMLMSAVIFREKITKIKIAALIMTFLGCILVTGLIGSAGGGLSFPALMIGLGAGFGYALYSIFAGFAVRKYSSLTITFYTLLLSGISLLFLVDRDHLITNLKNASFMGLIYCFGIAIICTVVPYIAYTAGLSGMEKSKAAVLVTIEPLVGTLLGIVLYNENVDIWKIMGIMLIFLSVILLGRKK